MERNSTLYRIARRLTTAGIVSKSTTDEMLASVGASG
jgi:hypothetical protein